MVLEEGGGPRQAEANMQGVAMTTLQVATARQCHTENQCMESKILTTYLPCQEGWAG